MKAKSKFIQIIENDLLVKYKLGRNSLGRYIIIRKSGREKYVFEYFDNNKFNEILDMLIGLGYASEEELSIKV